MERLPLAPQFANGLCATPSTVTSGPEVPGTKQAKLAPTRDQPNVPPVGMPFALMRILCPTAAAEEPQMLTRQHVPATEYGGQLQCQPAIVSPAPGSLTIGALSSAPEFYEKYQVARAIVDAPTVPGEAPDAAPAASAAAA
jgi:hypothetical protein